MAKTCESCEWWEKLENMLAYGKCKNINVYLSVNPSEDDLLDTPLSFGCIHYKKRG